MGTVLHGGDAVEEMEKIRSEVCHKVIQNGRDFGRSEVPYVFVQSGL